MVGVIKIHTMYQQRYGPELRARVNKWLPFYHKVSDKIQ